MKNNYFTKIIKFKTLIFLSLLVLFGFENNDVHAVCQISLTGTAGNFNDCFTRGIALGAGECRTLSVPSGGATYTFTFSNNAQTSGFCVNGTRYTGTTTLTLTSNATICMWRATGTWTFSSATLNYRKTSPGLTANSPTSATICTGGSVSISRGFISNGTGVFWQGTTSGGTSLANGSSPNSVSSSGTYYYRAYNAGCWGTQQGTSVSVVADPVAPSITRNPDATVCSGATLTVLSSGGSGGTGSCSNQYRFSTNNGASWSAWSTSIPSFSAVTGTNRVQSIRFCSGSGCNSNINEVSWTVVADPSVSISGGGATSGCQGLNPSLLSSSISGGTGSSSYQWQLNGSNISGATGSTYDPPALNTAGTYNYRVIHNRSGSGCGQAISNTITFTVSADPSVSISGGGPTTGCEGLNPTLLSSSISGGTGSSTYQWQLNGSNITGATGSTYDPPALNSPGTYAYRVIHNRGGVACDQAISNTITFTVVSDPTITSNPSDASICRGGSNTFTVSATGGTPSLSYQWQYFNGGSWANVTNGTPNGVTYSGATTTNLGVTTSGTTPTGAYDYRVLVNAAGSGCTQAVSSTGELTVNAVPSVTNPSSSNVCEGTNVNFSVTGSGGVSLSYSWQYFNGSTWVTASNGVPSGSSYSGLGSSAITVSGLSATGASSTYDYRVVVSSTGSGCSPATSGTATATISKIPTITNNSASLCEGESKTLTTDIDPNVTWSVSPSCPGCVSGNVFTAPDPGSASANYTITARNTTNSSCSEFFIQTVYKNVTADAGVDIEQCNNNVFNMSATTPTVGSGNWTATSGTVAWTNQTSPTATATLLTPTATVRWTVTNGDCDAFDEIVLTNYALPTVADAGTNSEICIEEVHTLDANNPSVGSGVWTWSSAPTYENGTSATDFNAQISFASPGTYIGTWTISNGTCTPTVDNVEISVLGSSANVVLVDEATVTAATDRCEEPDGWTYYSTASNPDEYVFAIGKNGNTFDAEVTIVHDPLNTDFVSTIPGVRGTWLIPRTWNVDITSGSITTDVCVRFFVDMTEIESARAAATAFTPWPNSDVTPLTFFKHPTNAFTPTGMLINGDFNFLPQYLADFGGLNPSAAAIASSNSGVINGVAYYELCGISSFSGGSAGFSVNDGGSPLPVELLDFSANTKESHIQLEWSTATEINNDGFEVQRSIDGENFETIAWVDGNGNTTIIQSYQYDDYEAKSGVNYYRLKQVDFDGEFEYTDIVSAKLRSIDGISISNLRPNPANESVFIDIQSNESSTGKITVYNHMGQKVALINSSLEKGENTIKIETAHLPSGAYFVAIESNDVAVTKKFVIAK